MQGDELALGSLYLLILKEFGVLIFRFLLLFLLLLLLRVLGSSGSEWCCEQRATCESCYEGKSEVAHGSFVHGFAYSDYVIICRTMGELSGDANAPLSDLDPREERYLGA